MISCELEQFYTKLNDKDPKKIIYEVLLKLQNNLAEDEIFLSEADFQFSFANTLKECGCESIILEYPIMANKLYEEGNKKHNKFFENNISNYNTCRTFIDVYFKDKLGNEYFVELKYKLEEIPQDRKLVFRHSEELGRFPIKQQGAENNNRYDIYRDIERMENIKKYKSDCKSFVIFLTNDYKYKTSTPPAPRNFPLDEEYTNNINKKNQEKFVLDYNTDAEKNKRRKLLIEEKYPLKWFNFKKISYKLKPKEKINKGIFKILVIDCNNPEPK